MLRRLTEFGDAGCVASPAGRRMLTRLCADECVRAKVNNTAHSASAMYRRRDAPTLPAQIRGSKIIMRLDSLLVPTPGRFVLRDRGRAERTDRESAREEIGRAHV